MRVFVTGGTGFIGTAVVRELIGAGHEVVGLARSEGSTAALRAAGADVLPGTLTDLEALRDGATRSDGVVHLAMASGDTSFVDALEIDRRALAALGSALGGSDRPLVFASGTSLVGPGRVVTEDDAGDPASRGGAETEVLALAARGVRVAVVRLATLVHGEDDRRGFLPMFVETARTTGVSAYVGDGANRWPGVHRLDAARLLRLALEGAPAGSRVHGVAEEGVPFRDIATAIGDGLGVPTVSIAPGDAADHFTLLDGPLAALPGSDLPASSAITRRRFGWDPRRPGVLADLASDVYVSRRDAAGSRSV